MDKNKATLAVYGIQDRNTKYFTGLTTIHPLSEFMLLDFKILPERKKELAGAIHADDTARFQTVFNRRQNPFIFDLLNYLDQHFNCKALINTSFNAKGEPIVHSVEHANQRAHRIGLDGLVLNGKFNLLK